MPDETRKTESEMIRELSRPYSEPKAPEGQPPAPRRYLGNDVTCSDATSSPEEQLSGKELQ